MAIRKVIVNPFSGKLQYIVEDGSSIDVGAIGSPALSSVKDYIDAVSSAGKITGGEVTAPVVFNGKVNISAGIGLIRTEDSLNGSLVFFEWDAEEVAITAGAVNYIYMDYNAGTPVIRTTTTRSLIKETNQFTMGRAYNDGAVMHVINTGINLPNAWRREHERLLSSRGFERADGAMVQEIGTRCLQSSPGVFYLGTNRLVTTAQDTSVSDTVTYWYFNGSAWVSASATQINNTQYNNVASGLATLTDGNYGVHWVFIDYNGKLHIVMGQDDYDLPEAQAAALPSTLPTLIDSFATAAAKIIILKSAAHAYDVASSYTTLFPVNAPASHNDLSGIDAGDIQHLTVAERAQISTLAGLSHTQNTDTGLDTGGAHAVTAETITTHLSATSKTAVTLSMSGDGAVISLGYKGYIRVPYSGTITGYVLTGDSATGSIKIDIWKAAYADFPPVNANSICNGHEPELVSAQKAVVTDVSNWSTVAVSEGDFIAFNVDSVDINTEVVLSLNINRVHP